MWLVCSELCNLYRRLCTHRGTGQWLWRGVDRDPGGYRRFDGSQLRDAGFLSNGDAAFTLTLVSGSVLQSFSRRGQFKGCLGKYATFISYYCCSAGLELLGAKKKKSNLI